MDSFGLVQIQLKNEEKNEPQVQEELFFDNSKEQVSLKTNKTQMRQCSSQIINKVEPLQQSSNTTRLLQITSSPTEEPLIAKPFGYKKIKKNFQDKSIPDAFFCKGGLQMDLDIFKLAGDNLERTNMRLIQQRQSLTSPFSAYRSPVRVESFDNLGFLEIELEEYLDQFSDFEYLIKRLVDMQTVIAYSNINAIQEHVRQVQKNEILRQQALKMYYKERTQDNQQISEINEKQQEQGKTRIKQEDQLKLETQGDNIQINSSKNTQEQKSQNNQNHDNKLTHNQDNLEKTKELEPLPELSKILQAHKAQTRTELKRILSSSTFNPIENNYYLFVVKCNQQSDLQNVVSSYGISRRLSDLCFGSNSNAYFPHFTLSNGIFHPFHDNYSHLQHILVHLLEYQDRQVILRTIDNYVFQACLRRYVFPLGSTQLSNANGFTLMDHMIVHQFIINPQQIMEIQKSRSQRKTLNQQVQNIYNLSTADVEYAQSATKFIEKFKINQESEANFASSHGRNRKNRLKQMEIGSKSNKQDKKCLFRSSNDKIIGEFDGATKVDYDSNNCSKEVPKVAELVNTIIKEEME